MSKVDELRAKYPSIRSSTFQKLENGDKTKTKKYLEFMLKTWSAFGKKNNKLRKVDDLIKLLIKFDTLLPYIENKDIYHKYYNSLEYLINTVEMAEEVKEEKTFIREEHVDIIDENDKYIAVHPKTHRGSLKYGANTKWCTASKSDPLTFSNYNSSGYLVYLISKQKDVGDNFEKVAFYLRESGATGRIEMYNSVDKEITERSLISSNWNYNDIFSIITKSRICYYNHQIVQSAKNYISNIIQSISDIDFDRLKKSIAIIDNPTDDDYILKLKESVSTLSENLKEKIFK